MLPNTGAHIIRLRNGHITSFHAYLPDLRAFEAALTRLALAGVTEAAAPPIVTDRPL